MMQRIRAYKRGRATTRAFPLPPSDLRVLLVLQRGLAQLPAADLARLAVVDLPTYYVVLGRLRRSGLVTTAHVIRVGASGRPNKFAVSTLTPDGRRVAVTFLRFLRALGPSLSGRLGWT